MAKAIVHTAEEIIRIRRAAQVTAEVRDKIAGAIEPGMSTAQLDQIAGAYIAETGGPAPFWAIAVSPAISASLSMKLLSME